MPKDVTFDDLQRVALSCGFRQTKVANGYRFYVHPPTKMTFHLPIDTLPARAVSMYLLDLRSTLHLAGIMERDDFEEAIRRQGRKPPKRGKRRAAS